MPKSASSDSFVIGIASYQRVAKQDTLDYLQKIGFPKSRIYEAVQTLEEYRNYTEAGVGLRVAELLYSEKTTAGGNRNTILDAFPTNTRILLMDDDVKALAVKEIGNRLREIDSAAEFEKIVDGFFEKTLRKHTTGFGIHCTSNVLMMSGREDETALATADFLGLINRPWQRFDEGIAIGEDYGLCAEIIRKHGRFMRFGEYTVISGYRSKGGCADAMTDPNRERRDAIKLAAKYPSILEVRGGQIERRRKK